MRRSILSALAVLAAVTVRAAPALACGYGTCPPCATPCAQTYTPTYSYAPAYSGCATGCNSGWVFEHLAEPATQYYYVNQGPTYTGPGAFAPVPTYEEGAVSGPAVYGYRWHHHPDHWGGYTTYHHGLRYGYMPYHYGQRVLRRYY
jgi:hypothetical protein